MGEKKEVREVFLAAVACDTPEERNRYLDEVCRGKPELRRRVEVLLRAHEQAGDFLEEPAGAVRRAEGGVRNGGSPKPGGTIVLATPLTEKPGDKIGPYKLLQQIGEGGCGVVYMAEQAEPIRRKVALKVIKLGMDTKQVIARFEAERQALALMDHPNIAKVLDAGATETGRPYFVMELVRGQRINEYCDENSLDTEARLGLFMQICHAIQHAHQKGIIHRDIKPSNILVTVVDGRPVPKAIDFGIAKAMGQQLTDKTLFTAFEQFIGTLAYMSPEQAALSGVDVDTRSDIYSLGVLLYELLTGHTPFDPKTLVAAGLDEMRRVIRENEPPKPSTRISTLDEAERTTVAKHRQAEPGALRRLVRGDLDWIVMKCLEKDRGRRYETANNVAVDIEHHLQHQPVSAAAPSTVYRAQKFIRRHKAGLAVTAALVLLLAVGVVVSTWQAVRATRAEREQAGLRQQAEAARTRAEANEKKAETEAARSAQVAQFLKDMLQGVGPSVALGRDTTMLREILDKTAERVDQGLKGQPEVEAELCNTIGEVYHALGQYGKAETMHRRALELRRQRPGDESASLARTLDRLAYALWEQNKLAEAEAIENEALAIRRKLFGNDHPDIADSLRNMAFIRRQQGRRVEMEVLLREALALQRKLLGREDPKAAETLKDLAGALYSQGKFEEAETLSREAVTITRKLWGNEHPDVAAALGDWGNALFHQGRFAEAETARREVLQIRRKVLGNEHPHTGYALSYLARVLRSEGKFGEAESAFREALAIFRKCFGNEHASVAYTLDDLAHVLCSQGRLAEAETAHREALPIFRKRFGNEHSSVANSRNALAAVLAAQGKVAQAAALQREAAEHGDLGAMSAYAWMLATCGDPQIRDGSKAVGFAQKAVAATSRTNASYLATLAAAYADAGQFGKAVAVQKEAMALLQDEKSKQDCASRLRLYESNTPYRVRK